MEGEQFTAFMAACKAGDVDTVRRMIEDTPGLAGQRSTTGETPVVAALYRGHSEVVEALLEAGPPVDLFTAAALGRLEDVQSGLAADPAAVRLISYDGWTPLHLAAFFGHPAVAGLLLAHGADINARSANSMMNTPLHAAVAGGRVDAALSLIEAGAEVNASDSGKHTPLHIAAEGGYVPIVEALLKRNADPHAVDAEDRTPLARAAAKNHAAVIDLITLHG